MICRQLMHASVALFLLAMCTQAQERGREPPSIQEPRTRSEMFVRRNQDVFLQCKAVGYPAIAYEWYWNDGPIQSTMITFDANSGTLQIKAITEREEGFFNCRAKNTYNGQEAIAISPKIEVRIARVGDFPPPSSTPVYTFTEGGYAKVPCDEKMPEHYGPTTFKWYKPVGAKLDEVIPNEQIFIDQEGSVHFAYIMKSDENLAGNREYQCAMSNSIADIIKLGRGRQVIINALGTGISDKKPALEYRTQGALLTVQRNANAQLECFFSGYENAGPAGKVPKVTWYDNQNNKITTGGRYQLDSDGRVLTIKNVVEEDEKIYTCEGKNTLGDSRGQLILNVTSTPIWLDPLKSTTAVQGTDAIFHCSSRSAASELPPGPPEWYKNGNRMGSSTDPTKYSWSDQNKKMTVKYVTKDKDIACFQCYVQNSVGIEFSDGCLNVILPITVTVKPENLEQEISRGDIVNLTVVATSDPLTPIKYRWIYKNVTFELNNAPPHVTYNDVTKLAYINTSLLEDEEYASIGGLYRREIYHQYEHKFIDITVSRKESPTAPPTILAAAGFDYWIIGLIIGILIILIVIIIIVCVICRRKMQEGQYPLGKKETAAGLDPEKDIKDSGFHDLSRADYDDYPEKGKLPAGPIDFEDIPIGVDDDDDFEGEYGEEATAFNEDGSFIGVYTRDNKNKAPQPPPYSAGGGGGPGEPTESNV